MASPPKSKRAWFRACILWIHLVCGLATGLVIALMSITGIGIAFEEEILAWYDREVAHVEPPPSASPKPLEELLALVRAERPSLAVDHLVIPSDPSLAYQFSVGWDTPVYVDPYTGVTADSRAQNAKEALHVLETLHRFFGLDGEESWLVGRHINGAANLVLLLLCVTGIYLWLPRVLRWSRFKSALFFKRRAKGHARDFNWHHVFGFWSLPGLAVLSATAVVISYEWGHQIPFLLYGEEPPAARNFGMMAVEPATTPTPPEGATPLPYDEIVASVAARYPGWVRIGIHLPDATSAPDVAAPLQVDLTRSDYMPSRAWAPLEVDPYSGDVLQAVFFEDRSPGLRARVWARFIHTGAGFGVWGKVIACLFTLASLVLVYTGFALSYRRFF